MTPEHAAVDRLLKLVGDYWGIAYAEGRDGRTHDTPDHSAQAKWQEIQIAALALLEW